ncbi:GSC2 [Symbiodinium necroappetens]|uniref:1,3-beta-glucan synthase n=1 Tax=Symbiodinium necroappetens TaxID=1628268 RepID=A0A812R2Z8_9DINO|nr:GSC2 [Symbiodinium necroappetens]
MSRRTRTPLPTPLPWCGVCIVFYVIATWAWHVDDEKVFGRNLRIASRDDVSAMMTASTSTSTCLPEEGTSDEGKKRLVEINCQHVRDAKGLDVLSAPAADSASFQRRYAQAEYLCRSAESDAQNASHLSAAAASATSAWNELTGGRECCNIPTAPHCSSDFGTRLLRFMIVLSILVVAFFPLLLVGPVVFAPSLWRTKPTTYSHQRQRPRKPFNRGGPKSPDQHLKEELRLMWMAHFRGMPNPTVSCQENSNFQGMALSTVIREEILKDLASLQAGFGFQKDSVKIQLSEIMDQLDSYRKMSALQMYEDNFSLDAIMVAHLCRAVDRLHKEKCCGFSCWLEKAWPDDKPGVLGNSGSSDRLHDLKRKLKELVVMQLVWGEAGNDRFMPEWIYFMSSLILFSCEGPAIPDVGEGGFLTRAVQPMYEVIFDAQFEAVDQPRRGFKEFYPEDCINYDDIAELFQDPVRLKQALPQVWRAAPAERYADYLEIDLKEAMKSVKTHRELHSLWAVFASTNRVWFLLSTMYMLSEWTVLDGTERPDTPLGAASMRFAALGLWVSIFGLLRACSRWFVTGAAIRSPGRFSLSLFLWLLPGGSFFVFRLGIWQSSSAKTAVAAVHLALSALGAARILAPSSGRWRATQRTWKQLVGRWLFWLILLTVMFMTNLSFVSSLERAITSLGISRPGDQTWHEIQMMSFSPGWNRDVILWLAIQSTGLVFYACSFQFYFSFGSFLLRQLLLLHQHGHRAVTEDTISQIPANLEKCLTKAGIGDPTVAAREIWNQIVEQFVEEDVLSEAQSLELKFSGDERPKIFNPSCHQRCSRLNLPSSVIRRIVSLAQNLSHPALPQPVHPLFRPALSVLIPHYGEDIRTTWEELLREDPNRGSVLCMEWLYRQHPSEFDNFKLRTKCGQHLRANDWRSYSADDREQIRDWASLRSQTLWRTVDGLSKCVQAMDSYSDCPNSEEKRSGLAALAAALSLRTDNGFTVVLAIQKYSTFEQGSSELMDVERMFEKYGRLLKVAYIDSELSPQEGEQLGGYQTRRYYSCLIDSDCRVDDATGKREPRYKVLLPGFPILGNGKGDNQNTALPYCWGPLLQTIDANQGAYLEQLHFVLFAMGEFRQGDGFAPLILGFPEYITSSIGAPGEFAAGAESVFGTDQQHTLNALGVRMHYGHPDIMNKNYMNQQGGVSKATKHTNLSEDIFAGTDFTLRGEGREIRHVEWMKLLKGRDLGFNSIMFVFTKLSKGTAEQLTSRQNQRLGDEMGLPECLAFFSAHSGFYLGNYLVSISAPMLVYVSLLALLFDDQGHEEPVQIVATMLRPYSWLLCVVIVCQSLPLLQQMWFSEGACKAFVGWILQQFTCAPIFEIFKSKLIGYHIMQAISYGGAAYMQGGRGPPTIRQPFVDLYKLYAKIALYDGVKLLVGVMVLCSAGLRLGFSCHAALALTYGSWLLAPFIFNPLMFSWKHIRKDWNTWSQFFPYDWVEWYEKGLPSRLRASPLWCLGWAFTLAPLYGVAMQKVHFVTTIYEDPLSSAMSMLMVATPPCMLSLIGSLAAKQELEEALKPFPCLLVVVTVILESLAGLNQLMRLGLWRPFWAGLLYKLLTVEVILEVFECVQVWRKARETQNTIRLATPWLCYHRMSRDLIVSFVLLSVLTLWALVENTISRCFGCWLHDLLMFRSPSLQRKAGLLLHWPALCSGGCSSSMTVRRPVPSPFPMLILVASFAEEKMRLLKDDSTSYMLAPVATDLSDDGTPSYDEDLPPSTLLALVEAPWFQSIVGAIILANALVIGLETDQVKEYDWLFPILEDTFLSLFAVELCMRLCAYGILGFFSATGSDGVWNAFDFTLVFLGVIDRGLSLVNRLKQGPQLYIVLMRVFRLLRILRIFRIFRVMRQLHILASSLFDAVQSVFWVSVICVLILYICAIVLTRLVGHPLDGDPLALVKQEYFGSLGSSMLTLFELMAFPNMVPDSEKKLFASQTGTGRCSTFATPQVYADNPSLKTFLVIFVIFGAFMMASILTGVITEGMVEKSRMRQEERRFERETARAVFIRMCRRVLQDHSGADANYIDKSQFEKCKDKVLSLCEVDATPLREKDLEAIFSLVDYDDSGIVEIEELLYGMVQVSAELRPMSILELRRSFARGLNAVSQQVNLLDSRLQMMDARLQEAWLGAEASLLLFACLALGDRPWRSQRWMQTCSTTCPTDELWCFAPFACQRMSHAC